MKFLPQDNSAIFRAVPLRSETVRRAFPLSLLFNPVLDLNGWNSYAKSFIRQNAKNGGLRAIEDGRGYIHAVYSYSIRPDLKHRKLLRIADVVIGHLPGKFLVDTMLDDLATLADGCGSDRVLVELAEGSAAREALWQAGFSPSDFECFLNERTYARGETAAE